MYGPLRSWETFLSTCPVRGTTRINLTSQTPVIFLSTCPVRGTTFAALPECGRGDISIHVPREGHDWIWSGFREFGN